MDMKGSITHPGLLGDEEARGGRAGGGGIGEGQH